MVPEENEMQSPPAPAEGAAGPIPDIDPAKLAELEAKLKAFKANQGKTESGSEAPDSPFDPTQFEYEPEKEHLYRRATIEEVNGEAKWVYVEHQYYIHSGQWHIEGGGQEKGKDKRGQMQYRAKGLDQIISEVINGPEGMLSVQKGWRLSALLPGGSLGSGSGVAVFERQVKRVLPDPKPIVKPEEVPLEETTDEELARMQERSKEWSGEGKPADEAEPDSTQTETQEGGS
jgi:hypothetical protein